VNPERISYHESVRRIYNERIKPDGITADGMAMRMMLLRNVMGASTYHYHTEQTVKTLRATEEGKTPYPISEPGKLVAFAGRIRVDTGGSEAEVAIRLCDFVTRDLNRKADEPSVIVEMLAHVEENRKKLGI
jgi:carbon-monoxide dehydrogenase catalytic subunit